MASEERGPDGLRDPRGGLTAAVEASFAGGDARLSEVLRSLVRHLHGFAVDVGLTRDEWTAGVRFLTAVGARCDDVRQEFILLSDTLGLSTLVELIDGGRRAEATDPTVLGPFYVPDPPEVDVGGSVVADPATGGEPVTMSGHVRSPDGRPIAGAAIDVWQVQPNGRYDVEDAPTKRNLRARLRTGSDGAYRFATVRPVDYTVPDDGPVGAMLRAAGRPTWRPAHVHFRITADGYRPLVTHVFDRTSPWLDRDAVFAVRPSLVADLDGGAGTFDFVLEPDRR